MSACLTVADFEAFESSQLAGDESARVRVHLDSCAECRSAYEQYRQSHSTLLRPPSPRVDETPPRLAVSNGPDTPATAESTSPARRMARHLPKIEGYRIMGVLGHGGMGIVYRAVQTKLNRLVALKVLPAIVSTANPAAASRFRREATAAARLHHTNIVPIYDYGESQDAYYYAMELISGQPMNILIHRFAEHSVASASPAHLVEILRGVVMDPSQPGAGEMADGGSSDGSFSARYLVWFPHPTILAGSHQPLY